MTVSLEIRDPQQWLASHYSQAEIAVFRDFFCSGMRGQRPTDAHLMLFMLYCKRHGIDPFSKQAHLLMTKNGPEVCLGIDSIRKFAAETGEYGGQDEPIFELDNRGNLMACKITVYRIVKGHRVPFPAIAWMAESRGNAPVWSQRPRGMLEKCAEAKALRKGFPERCGGLYAPEEFEGQAGERPAATPTATAADINARLKPAAAPAPKVLEAETTPGGVLHMLAAFKAVGVDEKAVLDYVQRDTLDALAPGDVDNLRAWYADLTAEDRP